MRKIRILIIDDSAVARRAIVEALSGDADLEVVGSASNGTVALASIPHLNPDIVTLDVEMPDMSGLQVLAAIRKKHPHLRVIMFSALTVPGVAVTLDALALGALDYVTKPSAADNPNVAVQQIRAELSPKIKALCASILREAVAPQADRVHPPATARLARKDIVAIGVSTGGPNALEQLLAALPADLGMPIVIVQHMPPIFTKSLGERLASRSALAVREAVDGEPLVSGTALVAPGGLHLVVQRDARNYKVRTHSGQPENSCRPSVDVLFRSVAENYSSRALAVVLTGMGQDGLDGARHIHQSGGTVLAQDEASSVVWGMPGAVVRAGYADAVLPLGHLAAEIMRYARVGRSASAVIGQPTPR
jgi:two-component system chemotaxis response regulator CheB